jgi:serine/threonine-protein phosphatase 6 regulatory ankyrin repeat subunit A
MNHEDQSNKPVRLYRVGSQEAYCSKLFQAIGIGDQTGIKRLFEEKNSMITIIDLICADKLDPNIQGKKDGNTLLHWAVRENNLNIMELLLIDKHTNPNIKNNAGDTPLGIAVALGKVPATQLLLQYKANTSIITQSLINPGDSYAFLHVAMKGYYDHKAYETKNNYLKIISLLLSQESINIDQQDSDGKTPLHYAVLLCDNQIVGLLLKSSHAINTAIKDNSGKTAFDYATELKKNIMRDLIGKYQVATVKK